MTETTMENGGAVVRVAALTPATLGSQLDRLRSFALPDGEDVTARAAVLARAAVRFLDPDDALRREAEEVLPSVTGFSAAMIRMALPHVFEPLRDQDGIVRVVGERAGRRLVGIVSAGNVPGVALPKMALALAAGSACFVKTAREEPLLAALYARAVGEVNACMGERVTACWWRGGSRELDVTLATGVDSLVAYGADATLLALEALGPRRLTAYGHRMSVAVVRLDRPLDRDVPARVALDVSFYDQLGCLSPQAVFLVGGSAAERRGFAGLLARELADLETRMPRGRTEESTRVAIRQLRDRIEWREIRGEEVGLWCSESGTEWTVLLEASARPGTNPLHRTVVLHPLGRPADLADALGDLAASVESIGVAPWPDPETSAAASALGIPRIVPAGTMQRPGLDWRQGRRDPMAGICAADETKSGAARSDRPAS